STMHIKHFVMLATFCFFILIVQLPSTIILFPYTTLFRSAPTRVHTSDFGIGSCHRVAVHHSGTAPEIACRAVGIGVEAACIGARSEEHTSELQSRENLVCRLLLEKKKKKIMKVSSFIYII